MCYKKFPPVGEKNSGINHPEYEVRETRVSDYLRRYGTGKIEDLPTTSAPEVHDDRTVDEMLDSEFEPSLGTETVDVLMEIERNKERFEKAAAAIEASKTDKKRFDDAISVLRDGDAPYARKVEAYQILQELEDKGMIVRAN